VLGWKDRKERAIAKMKGQSHSRQRATSALLPVATAALATGIFIADFLAPPEVVVSGLYVVVVLMASRFCRPSGVVLVAAGCIGLVLAAYFCQPRPQSMRLSAFRRSGRQPFSRCKANRPKQGCASKPDFSI
jgi:hypothetical protein